jgi:hypothetical protein
MQISEIIEQSRNDLEDTVTPYRWSDAELLRHYNKVLNEFCKRTLCFDEYDTTAITQIPIPSNTQTLTMDPRIISIKEAHLVTDNRPLTEATEEWLDINLARWRLNDGTPAYYVPKFHNSKLTIAYRYDDTYEFLGASNTTFSTAPNRITCAAGGLDIYAVGNSVQVTNTTSNNATFTVTVVASTYLTVTETPTAETNTSAILRKIMDTIQLSVYRYPLAQATIGNLTDGTSPTIHFTKHIGLVDGILREAYLKQDTECYDPQASSTHRELFELFLQESALEIAGAQQSQQICAPHYGAL